MTRTNEGGFDEHQEQRISDHGDRKPGRGACPNDRCYPVLSGAVRRQTFQGALIRSYSSLTHGEFPLFL